VRGAIGVYRGGGRITDEDTFAWLAISLIHLPVRDDAWARMIPEHHQAHLALWADIVRRAGGPWLPAPASLLAFTAWQAGDGTLATSPSTGLGRRPWLLRWHCCCATHPRRRGASQSQARRP
jgi:hypothetical protein